MASSLQRTCLLLLCWVAIFINSASCLKRPSLIRSRNSHLAPAPAPTSRRSSNVAKQLFAGGLSRSLAQFTLYPIDAMRTLAQTRDGRSLADVGAQALVRGASTTSFFAMGMGAIQFAVFGACRDRVGPLLASAAGAIASCGISIPQEVIKQRLVTGVYGSFREALVTIYQREGVLGFYNSWRPTMARNVPFVVATFTAQDYFQRWRLKQYEKQGKPLRMKTWEQLLTGTSSALVAVLITNPVDVVKTRMMTQAASKQLPYASAIECFRHTLKSEGPLAFYAGVRQRSLYICLLWGEQQNQSYGGRAVRINLHSGDDLF